MIFTAKFIKNGEIASNNLEVGFLKEHYGHPYSTRMENEMLSDKERVGFTDLTY